MNTVPTATPISTPTAAPISTPTVTPNNEQENIAEFTTHKITAFSIVDGKENDNITFYQGQTELVIPFSADQIGGAIISVQEDGGTYDSMDFEVFLDKDCTESIGDTYYIEEYDDSISISQAIPDKGTYYIKFLLTRGVHERSEVHFKVRIDLANGNNRNLKKAVPVISYQDSTSEKVTYKLTVKKAALVQVIIATYDDTNEYAANIQLLNSNKKKISHNSYVTNISDEDGSIDKMYQYFTVEKGIYYIQVDTACGLYELGYDYSQHESGAGKSKSNAATLKIGEDGFEDYLTVQDKTSKVNWYKFYVPSDQYLKATMPYFLDGELEWELVNAKGKVLWCSDEGVFYEGYYYHYLEGFYKKGTYYFKVYKGNKQSSLTYGIYITKQKS